MFPAGLEPATFRLKERIHIFAHVRGITRVYCLCASHKQDQNSRECLAVRAGRSLANICQEKRPDLKPFFSRKMSSVVAETSSCKAVMFVRKRMAAKRKVVPAKSEVNFVLPRVNAF